MIVLIACLNALFNMMSTLHTILHSEKEGEIFHEYKIHTTRAICAELSTILVDTFFGGDAEKSSAVGILSL